MSMKSMGCALILAFMAFAHPVQAEKLGFPLSCEPGRTCWVISYPDLDPEPGAARDYACGPGAADGDVFMRFGLANTGAPAMNMPVLAAADGTITDAGDAMNDRPVISSKQIRKGTSNCGNGVVIKHALGVQTAYCHLQRGSLQVKQGQKVQKGQVIAYVGQSGAAPWPQLGFSILSGGFFLDPVTGSTIKEGCGFKPRPVIELPAAFTEYQPVAIVNMGFAPGKIGMEAMAAGDAPYSVAIDADARTINLWALVLGVKKGDEIDIRIRDPRGRTFDYLTVTAREDTERMPVNLARDRGPVSWRIGAYRGEVKITRRVQNRPVTATRSVVVLVD